MAEAAGTESPSQIKKEAKAARLAQEPGATSDAAAEQNDTTFIASRRSFDIEMHAWYEIPIGRILTAGPYAAIGGSTVLDKNELQDEAVKSPNDPTKTLDTSKVSTSNDMDKYYEGGVIFNAYSGNVKDYNLYIQAILAYGNYEALAGLSPGHNTKHRFIGKLRVFPMGLNRSFFERSIATPMFGVDINAGRGEDHVKFFFGMVFNISKMVNNLKGKLPTE
jgi:hypothetical protein